MNLKHLDMDAVRESISHSGKGAAAAVERDAQGWIERVNMAADTLRTLQELPTGELLERAIVAEVFPLALDQYIGTPGEKLFLRRVEAHTELSAVKSGASYRTPHTYYDFGRGSALPPVLEVGKQYRVLVFVVERKVG